MIVLPLLLAASALTANIDPSVKPQDDFFRYANGAWLKSTEIPPEYSRWGVSAELIQRNRENLRTLCERASASTGTGSDVERLVGDFYASGMDEATINAAGVEPLRFEFDRIDGIKDKAALWAEMVHLQSLGVEVAFAFGSEVDPKNPDLMIAAIAQGGLGLPDRDYYFGARDEALRLKYVAHVTRMLELLGVSDPGAGEQARAILKLETRLAGASMTRVELRDPYARYHRLTRAELGALAPAADWNRFFADQNIPGVASLDVQNPAFVKVVGAELAQTSLADWQAYLRWHFLHHFARGLSDNFAKENFDFYGRTLTGTPKQEPRWKRVVNLIDEEMGEALGQLYVAAYFPPEAKAQALALVNHLRAALRERLQTVEWMDEATRQKALVKLDAFGVKIGYPDKWRDYSGLIIDRGPYVLNELKADAFEHRFDLGKIGKPPDRGEWHLSPPTVNAYYSPTRNEIVFPAAILQPPFFDPKADLAQNYGSIGSIIGHEMTHGFDDQGRQYGPKGDLTNWWTEESAAHFKARAQLIVQQFDAYEPLPGAHVNGSLTQGENIADLGGLKIAYRALHAALGDRPDERIDGLTTDQRFFLAYAGNWRTKYRPQEQLRLLRVDPHSPPEFRVRGPLSNLPEFFRAYDVPPGAPMRRPDNQLIEIW